FHVESEPSKGQPVSRPPVARGLRLMRDSPLPVTNIPAKYALLRHQHEPSAIISGPGSDGRARLSHQEPPRDRREPAHDGPTRPRDRVERRESRARRRWAVRSERATSRGHVPESQRDRAELAGDPRRYVSGARGRARTLRARGEPPAARLARRIRARARGGR